MTEHPFMTFTLVPQTDRRQVSDRRNFWRGGRRASDIVLRQQAIIEGNSADTILWSAATNDLRTGVEKPRLH